MGTSAAARTLFSGERSGAAGLVTAAKSKNVAPRLTIPIPLELAENRRCCLHEYRKITVTPEFFSPIPDGEGLVILHCILRDVAIRGVGKDGTTFCGGTLLVEG